MAGSLKNGDGRYDWVKVVQFVGPILLYALVGALFLMGLLETPSQKEARIKEVMSGHEAIPGHPVMVERVGGVDASLRIIERQVRENTKILARIEAKLE